MKKLNSKIFKNFDEFKKYAHSLNTDYTIEEIAIAWERLEKIEIDEKKDKNVTTSKKYYKKLDSSDTKVESKNDTKEDKVDDKNEKTKALTKRRGRKRKTATSA